MKTFAAALALAVLATGSASALARSPAHHVVKPPHQLYMYAPDDPNLARDQAIHDCSVSASKWSFSTWQTTQFATYGTCMAEHGQPQ